MCGKSYRVSDSMNCVVIGSCLPIVLRFVQAVDPLHLVNVEHRVLSEACAQSIHKVRPSCRVVVPPSPVSCLGDRGFRSRFECISCFSPQLIQLTAGILPQMKPRLRISAYLSISEVLFLQHFTPLYARGLVCRRHSRSQK